MELLLDTVDVVDEIEEDSDEEVVDDVLRDEFEETLEEATDDETEDDAADEVVISELLVLERVVEVEALVAKNTPTSAATRITIITTTEAILEIADLKRIRHREFTLK
jgi:hypothetical protein